MRLMRRVYDGTVSKNSRGSADKGKDPKQQLKAQIEIIHNARLDGNKIIYQAQEAETDAKEDMKALVLKNIELYMKRVEKAVEAGQIGAKDSTGVWLKCEAE